MSDLSTRLFRFLNRTSLVAQIVVGLIAGVVLALLAPEAARSVGLLGDLFVAALKAAAPILVFILVAASLGPITSAASRPTSVRSSAFTRWVRSAPQSRQWWRASCFRPA